MPTSAARVCFQGHGAMDRFRSQVGEALWDVDVASGDADSLRLSLDLVPLGTMAVAQRFRSVGSAVQLDRGPVRVERANHIAFGVCIVRRGTSMLVVEGRSLQVGAGSMYLMNATARFRKSMSADYSEDFVLAHSEMLASGPGGFLREPVLLAPVRGTAALLAEHMQGLLLHGADVEASALGGLNAALLGLIDATFSAQAVCPDQHATVREARRHKIEGFLRAHLHDPALTPARVAAAHRISLRYLNALFETSERSLCATLLELRLQACMRALEAAPLGLSIGDVAYAHGFVSQAHFCRAFKARFGVTPSAARAAAHVAYPRQTDHQSPPTSAETLSSTTGLGVA